MLVFRYPILLFLYTTMDYEIPILELDTPILAFTYPILLFPMDGVGYSDIGIYIPNLFCTRQWAKLELDIPILVFTYLFPCTTMDYEIPILEFGI